MSWKHDQVLHFSHHLLQDQLCITSILIVNSLENIRNIVGEHRPLSCRCSSVATVTRLPVGRLEIGGSILGKSRKFSNAKAGGIWGPPSLLFDGFFGELLLGMKRQGGKSEQSRLCPMPRLRVYGATLSLHHKSSWHFTFAYTIFRCVVLTDMCVYVPSNTTVILNDVFISS
jgi:hypothetical protein